MTAARDSGDLTTALDDHVERRPKTTPAGVAVDVGRWLVRLVVLVLVVDVVRILVTSKTIDWGRSVTTSRSTRSSPGVEITLLLTVCGMAIGIILGVVLALMRLSPSPVMNGASSFYLWFFRGTPLLVQILFSYNLASFIERITIGIPFGGPTFALLEHQLADHAAQRRRSSRSASTRRLTCARSSAPESSPSTRASSKHRWRSA